VRFSNGSENEGRRPSPREHMLRSFQEFSEPIAVLRTAPDGAQPLSGGEKENGRPYSIHVTYIAPSGQRLLVRTKATPLPVDPENPPRIVTIDTLHNAFGIYGRRTAASGRPPREAGSDEIKAWKREQFAIIQREREEFESLPRTPVSVLIDGVPMPGFRVDYPDCSGVELAWDGRIVQCVGEASAIDVLELRSAAAEETL
jgi:hypothetical protein